jgi:dolichol-phosphate mannosyltransferase
MATSDSLVIIPTYNEKGNVERMLETVMGLAWKPHVLIVDDGEYNQCGEWYPALLPDWWCEC